ncbi:Uncharacterized protein HDE_05063 [Halotydeus destructor]|nr:Uncharacterized protein HDE_05063 [Halotydeus destructor]
MASGPAVELTSGGSNAEVVVVDTSYGKVSVHVHGDLELKEKRVVFLTVHDIGTNHRSFVDFVDQPCMAEIRARSIFVHVDLPGQETGAAELGDELGSCPSFPSIQQLGEMVLPAVLDKLALPLVVGLGEGAGANVLARLGLAHPGRLLGLVLVHLVTAGCGVLHKLRDSFNAGVRRRSEAFTGGAGAPLVQLLPASTSSSKSDLNARNVRKYAEAYMNRKDIGPQLAAGATGLPDVLLVAGARAACCPAVAALHGRMVPQARAKASLLKLDGVAEPLAEAADKLAQALLPFLQGLGLLTGVRGRLSSADQSAAAAAASSSLGAVGRRKTLSMEEYDAPRPRRLSLLVAPAAQGSDLKE